MISAEEFLVILEDKDILPADAVRKLRLQLVQAKQPIPATAIAKRLIEKGYLTRPLAKRLLAKSPAVKPRAAEEDDDLQLAPDDNEKLGAVSGGEEEDYKLEVVEDIPLMPTATAGAVPQEVKPVAGDAVTDEVLAGQVVAGEVVEDAEAVPDAAGESNYADATAGASLAPRRRKGLLGKILPARSRRRKANVWDSSLLLTGGGALAILVILAFVFIWIFWGASGEAMIEAADSSYKEGSYQIAISQYDEFLKKFPDHQQSGHARVRRGLAMMRNATEGTNDYAKSLTIAVEVLGQISSEDAFGEARDELRSLLPTISEGLAKQAHEKTSAEYVEKTRQSLALVEKYISKSNRPATLLDDVNALLAMTEIRIARDGELAKAAAEMKQTVADGKTARAYEIRRGLLQRYPELLDNEDLRNAVLAVAAAEKAAVKFVAEVKKAQIEPAAADGAPAVSLALRTVTNSVPDAKGNVVFASAAGAAYALDAVDGRVLWRRETGFSPTAQIPPMQISAQPGSDALVADAKAQSLLRLEAATGKLRWQQTVGEPFDARPVIDERRVLVAARSGRLVVVDLESGDSPGYMQLPQALTTPPAVDAKRSRIYQAAEHSNLYVLAAADGKCEEVVYLGHEPGEIAAAPVIIGQYLVIAQNRGANSVVLRVLSLEPKDKTPAPFLLHEVELEGRVDTPPVVSGMRMLVTTDQGRVYALRISSSNAAQPLEKIGQLQTSEAANLVRYSLLEGEQFWVADDHLTKYEIQASLGTLKTRWNACKDSVFLQPPTAAGNSIFCVRRRAGLPGVIVSAISMNEPNTFWETHLAAGPAAPPVVVDGGKKVEIVTALGSAFVIDAEKLTAPGQTILDQPAAALTAQELQRPVDSVARMADGLLALAGGRGSEQLDVFDPAAEPKKFRPLVLPDALAARPISFGGGIMVPSRVGQIFVLDPRGGGNLLEPFQPQLGGGSRPEWTSPVDAGEQAALLCDGRRTIYRLAAKQDPKPHLAALDKVELDAGVASSPAVVAQTAFVVDEKDNLRAMALPKLTPGKTSPLGGKCIWGPCGAGERLFAANDEDKLLCFDAEGTQLWQIGLIHGRPVGSPLAVEGGFIFASHDGTVWRVDAADGRETAKLETGRPLAAAPVLLGERLLLCGHDGTLYLVDQPK